ncbi:MAG: Rne/Rng family ribonuclease [Deltaproteobacteria bacterium]|nr:Rne/Rng family ribonuclease [Deltaproteobacteria bacterium]MCB9478940.1 Rne/Rng family ribonuclease [Deltaproteobacteria bacterium]MCB9489444.1 Rne/Rng family ribonuclease [Deltaproteobacteria bacterium]
MSSELIINVTEHETRVALLEHGVITEFHVESARKVGVVGNIYKGRVLRVLPGMQAAFVDIGLERAAFLYVTDVVGHYPAGRRAPDPDVDLGEDDSDEGGEAAPFEPTPTVPIEKLVTQGQEILVQVAKEPLGTKGARLTTNISLPGRYLVIMPTMEHIGVSRRIEDEQERERLKTLVETIRPNDHLGFIIRTVAEEADEETLQTDIEFLVGLWEQIQVRYKKSGAPSVLHSDLSITRRAVRDLLTKDVVRLVIDDKSEFEKIKDLSRLYMPQIGDKVEFYDGDEPIFEHFNLEVELGRALQPKVWLKSGSYIIIEHTEALTTVDVNTGRFIGHQDFDETIYKTNLEAVKEIAYQLRLRNIGGIIIIDFIDMKSEEHRERVYEALIAALKTDKARTNVLHFSELGLVEMTRKRTRENLVRSLSQPCPYCEGKGYVKSRAAICAEIIRALKRAIRRRKPESIDLVVHPDIADLLLEEEQTGVEELEADTGVRIAIKDKPSLHIEQFEIQTP